MNKEFNSQIVEVSERNDLGFATQITSKKKNAIINKRSKKRMDQTQLYQYEDRHKKKSKC